MQLKPKGKSSVSTTLLAAMVGVRAIARAIQGQDAEGELANADE